jgi:Ser/Thr protein kinase RdoA (MazF antagonist)
LIGKWNRTVQIISLVVIELHSILEEAGAKLERRIKERFSPEILGEAQQAYHIPDDDIQLLDGFESFIYEFQRDSEGYILRIGHSLRRPENLIRGEVDWINFLHRGGAGVSRAILADDGQLVVAIDDGHGEKFLATAFEKAHGSPPARELEGPQFFESYGRLIGRMHSLTKGYTPQNPDWKRPDWDDPSMLEVLEWLPESEAGVAERYIDLKRYLDQLPRDANSYGLIHFDAHLGNLFVDEQGKFTLFDFDDCNYSWFANDIAIVLFYIALGKDNQAAFVHEFMTHFLKGYGLENNFENRWLEEIPNFLKLREIDLYAVIHRSFDVENIDHPWVAMFMENRKQRIENAVPVIEFSWGDFA